MTKSRIGVIHGRFQVLHLGHMEYLLAGQERCDFLYIGITNPDPHLTATSKADEVRSTRSANPMTYYERLEMIRDAMVESGVLRNQFEIVPFPINFPDLLHYYVPTSAIFYVTIYDDWGREKLNVLKEQGLIVEVMWERSMSERLTTGKQVRALIARDGDWHHLVPGSVQRYIETHSLVGRIKELCK
jgi:cytidyltransferase-like protein